MAEKASNCHLRSASELDPQPRERCRILVVDDHSFVVEGLQSLIRREPDLEVAGGRATADDLTDAVSRYRANVVTIDIVMPGSDPFDEICRLLAILPQTRVVILSAHIRADVVAKALGSGAAGYLLKSEPAKLIIQCLRVVAAGAVVLSPEVLMCLAAVTGPNCATTKAAGGGPLGVRGQPIVARAGALSNHAEMDRLGLPPN